jgi:hypothetical protein
MNGFCFVYRFVEALYFPNSVGFETVNISSRLNCSRKWTPAEEGFSCELHQIVYLSWGRSKFWCISGWYMNN